MAASWPSGFQELLNQAGFSLAFPRTYIESENDVGPRKRRNRTTQGPEKFSCSIVIEKSQYATFKNFYDVTLANGVLSFEYDHPFTGTLTEFIFLDTPSIVPIGGTYFNLSMSWEEVL